MKITKYIILILSFQLCFNLKSSSQNCSNIKVLGPSEVFPITPLPVVRANDVMWHRRLWREIDLTESINHLLYFPNQKEERNCCLYDILSNYIGKGLIKAYDSKDDMFTRELTLSEIQKLTGDSLYDDNGIMLFKKLDSRDVVRFWLKEDWFFNSNTSKVDVRIMGICPVKYSYDENGVLKGYKQLFWLYYPHLRDVLVNHEALKKKKETDPRVSFDDVFIKRMFDSYIIRKNNRNDLHVNENKTELGIVLEKQKTRIHYQNKKTGLWGN